MGDELQWAVTNGDIEKVKTAVEKMSVDVNKNCPNGRPPICVAADYGQTEVIQYLLSKDADLNSTDKYGMTPLLSAIYEGHTGCVKFLLSKGAKKDLKAPDGRSYLESAEIEDIKALLR